MRTKRMFSNNKIETVAKRLMTDQTVRNMNQNQRRR